MVTETLVWALFCCVTYRQTDEYLFDSMG